MPPYAPHILFGSTILIFFFHLTPPYASTIRAGTFLKSAFILFSHLTFGLSLGLVSSTINFIACRNMWLPLSSHDVPEAAQPPLVQHFTSCCDPHNHPDCIIRHALQTPYTQTPSYYLWFHQIYSLFVFLSSRPTF